MGLAKIIMRSRQYATVKLSYSYVEQNCTLSDIGLKRMGTKQSKAVQQHAKLE